MKYQIVAEGVAQYLYSVEADSLEEARNKFLEDKDVKFVEEIDGSFERGNIVEIEEDK